MVKEISAKTFDKVVLRAEQRLAPLLDFSAETAAAREITGLFRWPKPHTVGLIGVGLGLILLAGYVGQQLFG